MSQRKQPMASCSTARPIPSPAGVVSSTQNVSSVNISVASTADEHEAFAAPVPRLPRPRIPQDTSAVFNASTASFLNETQGYDQRGGFWILERNFTWKLKVILLRVRGDINFIRISLFLGAP